MVHGRDRDLQTATDSTTGKIYTPLGYEGNKMLIYNPAQATPGAASVGAAPDGTSPAGLGTFSAEVMPGGYQKGSTGYSFVWSEVRKRFILFGGRNVIGAYMWEYHPSTKNWTELPPKGYIPPLMANSCMVPAYNGTKMILFGGRINDTVTQGSIYILDLPKRVWTKGPNVNPSQYRSHMACGVSGDNFLAWGGLRRIDPNLETKLDATPVIFNINTFQWASQFVRVTHYTPPASPTPTPKESDADKSSNTKTVAIIGGSIAGVVVLVVAVTGIVILRRHHYGLRVRSDTSSPPPAPDVPHGQEQQGLEKVEAAKQQGLEMAEAANQQGQEPSRTFVDPAAGKAEHESSTSSEPRSFFPDPARVLAAAEDLANRRNGETPDDSQ
ncbi:hypothetical protein BGX29_003745, partial [Mortierella sp. GBA35]